MQGDPALLNKYKQSHLESYMEDNQRVAFCPSTPWCGRAIEVRVPPCRAAWHSILQKLDIFQALVLGHGSSQRSATSLSFHMTLGGIAHSRRV